MAFSASDAVTAFTAIEADVALAADVANDELIAFKTYDAVAAYDDDNIYDELTAFKLYDAVIAYDAVPNNEPVMPVVTFNEPVIVTLPLIFIFLSENISNIARLPVLTENIEPETVSSIVNILPNVPSTVNKLDPLPCIDVEPVTPRDPVI